MTRTRFTLDDLGTGLRASSLISFIRHLTPDSALRREQDPDLLWTGPELVPQLLAKIADSLEMMRWQHLQANTKRHVKVPEPIPRPWAKRAGGERRIGKGAIPVDGFDDWYYSGEGGADGQC